jgi:mRNA deadenylase 3'-5' endonuclease subunit Ccr4
MWLLLAPRSTLLKCSSSQILFRKQRRRTAATFTVFHWNVLASYLGKNTNPWFLHGIQLDATKRSLIFERYYSKNEDLTLKCPGWPSYVEGILTIDEQKQIESIDDELFAWPKRIEKIKTILTASNADVLSLVELDAFEEVLKHVNIHGYSGEFVSRPRLISKDGCGLFWKRSEFDLVNKSRIIFTDRYKPDPKKDRCALLCLLYHRSSKQHFLLVSTHLARDSFAKAPRDAIRARQLGELAIHVREFLLESTVSLYDTPVVICGDVNAVSMVKLAGLVQASALMASASDEFISNNKKLHPFIFASKAVDTRGVTSRTEAREVRVDAILYSAGSLEAQPVELNSEFEDARKLVIPNQVIPSDHFPLLARVGMLSKPARVAKATRKWWAAVLPQARVRPAKTTFERLLLEEDLWVTDSQLDPYDLQLAFEKIDVNKSGYIEVTDALESLKRLDILSNVSSQVRQRFCQEQVFCRALNQDKGLDFVDFCAIYFLLHPVCSRCADVAFDHIDASPKNDFVTIDELTTFFQPFDRSPLQGDASLLFEDAKRLGLATEEKPGLTRSDFKTFLGARFVETMYEDEDLKQQILRRMGTSRLKT